MVPHKIQEADASAPGVLEGRDVKTVPGNDLWSNSPNVNRDGQDVNLNGNHVQNDYDNASFPVFRDSS